MRDGFFYMRDHAAYKAGCEEALGVVERWKDEIARGSYILWSPTIRCAVIAGLPWLDVNCPDCHTSRAIDIRTIDRHPLASVGSLVDSAKTNGLPPLSTKGRMQVTRLPHARILTGCWRNVGLERRRHPESYPSEI